MCGGTDRGQNHEQGDDGLSPRVRGNPCAASNKYMFVRSIPACAGEPKAASIRLRGGSVYPRVCGGTLVADHVNTTRAGLSPRVRGNPTPSPRQWSGPRSIPACAGEPRVSAAVALITTVYPRVCGGTCAFQWSPGHIHGLSPRVRGNHRCELRLQTTERSIPACAGEPARRRASEQSSAVYPRVCGGTPAHWEERREHKGLSPRVRGNRSPGSTAVSRMGSIPACAGEPG